MNKEKILENADAGKKQTVRQSLLNWLGFLAVAAAILFFFAPESWWQFGVSPVNTRKNTADFTLREINGGDWNFTQQRGKVIVINYWATWCPPCRLETPGLVNTANDYESGGVSVVGVSMDENTADVPPFVEKYKIPYQILLPGSDPNVSPEGIALPTTFLYDKKGNLAKKYTGIVLESTLKSDIEELLSEN